MTNKLLKEADYNISINGLQSNDAETLSQILSLAGQAENNTPAVADEEPIITTDDEVSFEPDTFEPEADFGAEQSEVVVDEVPPMEDDFGMESEEPVIGNDEVLDEATLKEINSVLKEAGIKEDLLLSPSKKDPSNVDGEDTIEISKDKHDIEMKIKDDDFEESAKKDSDIKFDVDFNKIDELKNLDEAEKVDLPHAVGCEDNFADDKEEFTDTEPGENQRPKYVKAKAPSVMGSESTKGFEEPKNIKEVVMTMESNINVENIKKICESAKRTYDRNSKSMYKSIDNRFIKRLMEAGCSSENAIKLLSRFK